MGVRYPAAHVKPEDRILRFIRDKHLAIIHLDLPLASACPPNPTVTNPFQIKSAARGSPYRLNAAATLARQPAAQPLMLPSNVSLPAQLYPLVRRIRLKLL